MRKSVGHIGVCIFASSSRGISPRESRRLAASTAPFPAGPTATAASRAAANLDKTQEQRVRRDSSRRVGDRLEKEEEKEERLLHGFKIRLLLPRMRGYLQILQRYRMYIRNRRLRPGLDKEN